MANRALRRIRRNTASTDRLVKQFNLELEHNDDGYRKYHWMPRDRSVIYVAYLTHDPDCNDPISNGDCNGRIVTKHDDKAFLQHVGRDSDGEPILDEFAALYARLKGEDLDGFCCDSNILYEMWVKAAEQGKVGTPYAVPLETLYRGGYREVPWDDDRKIEAVWIPDDPLLEELKGYPEAERARRAYERFEVMIEEYNKWAEGDTWGVTVDEFTRTGPNEYERTDNDSCWGYIDHEYALDEASGNLLGYRNNFLANHGKKEHAHDHENQCTPGPSGEDDRQHLGAA